ncbi:MAG: hypothetical protein WAV04_03180 [Candidatus Microsaccharimonas sp.]
MTVKQVFIMIGIFIGVAALTVGGLMLFRYLTSGDESVQSNDVTTFTEISDITFVPALGTVPAADNGWINYTTEVAREIGITQLKKASCRVTIEPRKVILYDASLKDYALSRDFAKTVAAGEQAELSDDQIIKIASNKGEVQFFTGIYHPTYGLLTEEIGEGNTPPMDDNQGKLEGDRTTFIAARLFNNPLEGEDIGDQKQIPAIVYKHACMDVDFDKTEALTMFGQVEIDFASPASTAKDSTKQPK